MSHFDSSCDCCCNRAGAARVFLPLVADSLPLPKAKFEEGLAPLPEGRVIMPKVPKVPKVLILSRPEALRYAWEHRCSQRCSSVSQR